MGEILKTADGSRRWRCSGDDCTTEVDLDIVEGCHTIECGKCGDYLRRPPDGGSGRGEVESYRDAIDAVYHLNLWAERTAARGHPSGDRLTAVEAGAFDDIRIRLQQLRSTIHRADAAWRGTLREDDVDAPFRGHPDDDEFLRTRGFRNVRVGDVSRTEASPDYIRAVIAIAQSMTVAIETGDSESVAVQRRALKHLTEPMFVLDVDGSEEAVENNGGGDGVDRNYLYDLDNTKLADRLRGTGVFRDLDPALRDALPYVPESIARRLVEGLRRIVRETEEEPETDYYHDPLNVRLLSRLGGTGAAAGLRERLRDALPFIPKVIATPLVEEIRRLAQEVDGSREPITAGEMRAARTASAIDIMRQWVGDLRARGSERRPYRGQCPFHDDPSTNFYTDEQGLWICYYCDAGGDLYDFVMRVLGVDITEALRYVARQGRWEEAGA